jgi:hypothetical protein
MQDGCVLVYRRELRNVLLERNLLADVTEISTVKNLLADVTKISTGTEIQSTFYNEFCYDARYVALISHNCRHQILCQCYHHHFRRRRIHRCWLHFLRHQFHLPVRLH